MGITVHYSGCLRDAGARDALTDELIDIASTLGWPHQEFRSDYSGVVLEPHPQCEALALLFDSRGILRDPVTDRPGSFCKTQFAPVSVHIAIIRLFRHLKERYFGEFEISDEGGYWDHADREELVLKRAAIADALGAVADPKSAGAADDLASRIAAILAQHAGRSIELTEDERRRVLGPSSPDPVRSAHWSTDRWLAYFKQRDEERCPLLRALRDRGIALADLRAAIREADEEDRKDEEASVRFMAQAEQSIQAMPAPGEEAETVAPEDAFRFEATPDPASTRDAYYELGITFLRRFGDRVSSTRVAHPAIRAIMAMAGLSLVGLRMGYHWAAGAGTAHPVTAQRLLAAERFETVGRLLHAFPRLGLGDLSPGAARLARQLREAASRA